MKLNCTKGSNLHFGLNWNVPHRPCVEWLALEFWNYSERWRELQDTGIEYVFWGKPEKNKSGMNLFLDLPVMIWGRTCMIFTCGLWANSPLTELSENMIQNCLIFINWKYQRFGYNTVRWWLFSIANLTQSKITCERTSEHSWGMLSWTD